MSLYPPFNIVKENYKKEAPNNFKLHKMMISNTENTVEAVSK